MDWLDRILGKKKPIPETADVMTVKEFISVVDDNSIQLYKGTAYLSSKTEMSNIKAEISVSFLYEVLKSGKFTHVTWIPKL